jgi:hypothetical protein
MLAVPDQNNSVKQVITKKYVVKAIITIASVLRTNNHLKSRWSKNDISFWFFLPLCYSFF